MSRRLSFWCIPVFSLGLLCGCATVTGPAVTRQEVQRETDELQARALAFQIEHLQRLYDTGRRLMFAVGRDAALKTRPQPYLGIVGSQINDILVRMYSLSVRSGVVVVVVEKGSPAEQAGLRAGDCILKVDRRKVATLAQFDKAARALAIGGTLELELMRGAGPLTVPVRIAAIPYNIPIVVVNAPEVNAATDGRAIYVTYGLLGFAASDDEIAAVIGHELAHAVRGHVARLQGGNVLGTFTALVLGIAADAYAPGSGQIVMRGAGHIGNVFRANYSRDLEREADYFGTRLMYYAGFAPEVCATFQERFAVAIPATMVQGYLSSHPSSAERAVRIRKTVEELKNQETAGKGG